MIARPNLFTRPDTLLGVCEGLGEETGIPPIVFRLGFAVPLIFAPFAVIATYLALGMTVMVVRWLLPPVAAARQAVAPVSDMAKPRAENDDIDLARAA